MLAFSNLKPIYLAFVIIHSESASGYDASANSTAKANLGTSAPNDSLPPQKGKDEGTKKYSLDHIFARTDPNVLADKTKVVSDRLETVLTTPKIGTKNAAKPNDNIIVVDDSEEDEEESKNEEIHYVTNDKTEDISASIPPSPSSLPTKLKEHPSKFNELTDEVKALKTQVHGLEIEILRDLKELPTKLEEFTTTVTSIISQVAELKSLKWELLAEFISVPNQVASVQAKLKTLDALPSLLHKKVKKFDFVTEDGKHIHLTEEQINQQKEIEEEAKAEAEAARREGEIRKEELIDLVGPEVVNNYYNDKLQYDRYCDKMLNKRAKSRITNFDIFTRKGQITLKVYIEDDTSEIIPEFKASDLHLGEWREVVTACPNKKGKGWTSIYKQIQKRIDCLRITEAELGIDLYRPLSEQDPLDRLNDRENKKRRHADDIHDFFRANKRLKSSVQYEDHPNGIVLIEPVIGMILFNSYHIQDFVTIEYFRDFPNTMLYTIQEIFFKLHQGPGMDDHAKTFSSFLLAKVDKRNLNPLKQIRVVEQMRQ
nr:hypothetical protein [Tanacetum cinerariifolium]